VKTANLCSRHSRAQLAGIQSPHQDNSPIVSLDARQQHSGMTRTAACAAADREVGGGEWVKRWFDSEDEMAIQSSRKFVQDHKPIRGN